MQWRHTLVPFRTRQGGRLTSRDLNGTGANTCHQDFTQVSGDAAINCSIKHMSYQIPALIKISTHLVHVLLAEHNKDVDLEGTDVLQ